MEAARSRRGGEVEARGRGLGVPVRSRHGNELQWGGGVVVEMSEQGGVDGEMVVKWNWGRENSFTFLC